MKRAWVWLVFVALAIGAISVVASRQQDSSKLTNGFGLSPAGTQRVTATRPICTPGIAPVGDCITHYLANLPDPGMAGEKTLEGIDSEKDGVRDHMQRFIALHYGESERAVRTLTNIAKSNQLKVIIGDSLSRGGAIKLAPVMINAAACFMRSVNRETRRSTESSEQAEVTARVDPPLPPLSTVQPVVSDELRRLSSGVIYECSKWTNWRAA